MRSLWIIAALALSACAHHAPARDASLSGIAPGPSRTLVWADAPAPSTRTTTSTPTSNAGGTSDTSAIALPYSLERVISTFSDCRGGGRTHQGLDIAGVGEDAGLGTPVFSMTRARVMFIGRPEDDPDHFGRPDERGGTTERGGRELPRSRRVPGYGRVHFFTRTYGTWRSGAVIVTEAVGGPLDGHQIRYMHLGAIRPDLEAGDLLEAGEELGLMGGTAIMDDSPHVHIDIEDENGDRVDVAPFLGLPADPGTCHR